MERMRATAERSGHFEALFQTPPFVAFTEEKHTTTAAVAFRVLLCTSELGEGRIRKRPGHSPHSIGQSQLPGGCFPKPTAGFSPGVKFP